MSLISPILLNVKNAKTYRDDAWLNMFLNPSKFQVFISMYADHPKFRVLLLMMDDASLPADLQSSASVPMSKDQSIYSFLGSPASGGLTGMDRQFSTPVSNMSTLETLHEGVAGPWAENKDLQGRLSPKINRKGANRSPPLEPVRRAASAHSAYAPSGLSPIQQLQKMEQVQRMQQGGAPVATSTEVARPPAGSLPGLQGMDAGSEATLSRESGGVSLQKMDVVSGLALPSVDELGVENMSELLAQMSVAQGTVHILQRFEEHVSNPGVVI